MSLYCFSEFQTIAIDETLAPTEVRDRKMAAARELAKPMAANF